MATYFSQKSINRMRMRTSSSSYGPPAPYPYQRNPVRDTDLRSLTRGGNPKYLEQRRGVTDYQQFRAGKSLPGYNPVAPMSQEFQRQAGARRAIFMAARMRHFRYALAAAGITPQGIALNLTMELLDHVDFDSPWAYQVPEVEGGYEWPPGGTVCCPPVTGKRDSVSWQGASGCGSTYLYCGLTGQSADMKDGVQAGGYTPLPTGNFRMRMGPGTWISPTSARMTYDEVRHYKRGEVTEEPKYTEGRPRLAMPLPRSAPPMPTITETIQSSPSPRDYLKPYERPAIEISAGGNTRGPVHPVHTTHKQLPPGNRVREKKEKMEASAVGRFIYSLYDATTESAEIVDILYDNLGKKCKGAKGMSAKANCVWRNLSTLDVGQAVQDIIQNHYEDKIWGRFYGAGKKAPFGAQLPGGTLPKPDFGNIKGPGIEQLSQIWR